MIADAASVPAGPALDGRFIDQVLESTTSLVCVRDQRGRFLMANGAFCRLLGRSVGDVVGRLDLELLPRAWVRSSRRRDRAVLAGATAVDEEEALYRDGRRYTFLSTRFAIRDPSGRPYAVCLVATDVSERREYEEVLDRVALGISSSRGDKALESLVRHLAESLGADMAFIGVLEDGRGERARSVALWLDGRCRRGFVYDLAGTPCENVVGRSFVLISRGVQELYPGDNLMTQFGFDSYAAYPLYGADGVALGLVAITSRRPMARPRLVEAVLKIFAERAAAELERIRAEQARQLSEASYRQIFEVADNAVFVIDPDSGGRFDVNPRACELFGYTRGELLARDIGEMGSGEPLFTGTAARRRYERVRGGKTVRFEWSVRHRDGRLLWLDVALKRVVIADRERVLAFMRDITERRRADDERARLGDQLRQAQKMEAIGHLTGGIAHDFNNILTTINGYSDMALGRRSVTGDATLMRYLEQIRLAGDRARDLIRQMLTFSRGQRGEPRPLLLGPLVKESVKLFGSTFPSTIALHTDVDGVRAVVFDPIQAEQVLMNLCINARDAVDGHGIITVRVGERRVDSLVCASCQHPVTGTFVEMVVVDDGPGIDAAVAERMFEPFFTTKEVGKGSGMGLATVHGIVHDHGGHILVDTAPGAGAAFRVLLPPSASDVVERAGEELTTDTGHGLHGHVLVVDDEVSVAGFMRDLLESRGFRVSVAGDGMQALQMLDRTGEPVDVVVADQTMPRMTGTELAERLAAMRPGLPVVLYTGYLDSLTEKRVQAASVRALLGKPVDAGELIRTLEGIVGRRPGWGG